VTDMNHAGVTVPDIDAAINWYLEVFACSCSPARCTAT